MMEQLYKQLENVLKSQYRLAALLSEECKKQNSALRQNDITLLGEAVAGVEELGLKMREAELKRVEIVSQLEEILKLPAGAKLSELVSGAPDELSIRLLMLRREIRQVLEDTRQMAELNDLLTRNAMKFNETLIDMFRQLGGITYGNQGESKNTGGLRSTISKSV